MSEELSSKNRRDWKRLWAHYYLMCCFSFTVRLQDAFYANANISLVFLKFFLWLLFFLFSLFVTRHTSSVQRVHINKPVTPLLLRSSNPSLTHRLSWTPTGKQCVINHIHNTEVYKSVIILVIYGKATGTVSGLSSTTHNTPYPVHDFSSPKHKSLFFVFFQIAGSPVALLERVGLP